MQQNIDASEIAKFNQLAADWWNPNGFSAILHIINPVRLNYIQQHTDLNGKRILDVGCGAGILSESLAKAGGQVTGIDASPEVIKVATQHAAEHGLNIEYKQGLVEEIFAAQAEQFDIITCMEVIEHVPDPGMLLKSCAKLLKPNGLIFLSTINRNPKSYLLAIMAAEYILRLLPRHTHDYKKLIKPSELQEYLRYADLDLQDLTGMAYNPLLKHAKLTKDVSVNYLAYAIKNNL